MIPKKVLTAFVVIAAAFRLGGGDVRAVETATPAAASTKADKGTNGSAKSTTAPTADDVLQQLLAGNERFVKGELHNPRCAPDDFRAVANAQYPLAVIVACADSRVSPELLFDMGVGDLFVIRVAGNVVDGAGVTVKGSIEYAIAELHVPLVVVLGHSNCGAVKSAAAHINHKDSLPGSINGLVELIKPAVLKVEGKPGDIYANATRENVKLGVDKLNTLQPILAPRVKSGGVKVVGGVYDLHTGKVELLQSGAQQVISVAGLGNACRIA